MILMNHQTHSFDKINFLQITWFIAYFYKGAYLGYIDCLKFGEVTLICKVSLCVVICPCLC